MTGEYFIYTLICLMVMLWSGNYIVAKLALRQFPPVLLVGLRMTLAGIIILPIYWWKQRNGGKKDRWTRADLPMLIYLGVFGAALNQFFFVFGLSRTSVAHSSIIVGMTPILVLLIAALMKLEQLTARKAAGMAIALIGVAILKAFETRQPGGGPTWTGDLLILTGVVTFALFTTIGKRMSVRHTPVTVITFAYVGGALVFSPITLWNAAGFSFGHVTLGGWLCVVYMALFSSITCYLIFYYALTHIAASRVSAFSYLQPFLATVMAVFLLGEHITPSLIAGGTVIFSGVYLAERG